jgi:hypothetical protein
MSKGHPLPGSCVLCPLCCVHAQLCVIARGCTTSKPCVNARGCTINSACWHGALLPLQKVLPSACPSCQSCKTSGTYGCHSTHPCSVSSPEHKPVMCVDTVCVPALVGSSPPLCMHINMWVACCRQLCMNCACCWVLVITKHPMIQRCCSTGVLHCCCAAWELLMCPSFEHAVIAASQSACIMPHDRPGVIHPLGLTQLLVCFASMFGSSLSCRVESAVGAWRRQLRLHSEDR